MQSGQKFALLFAACIALRGVVGYESVYDLIERQNQRRLFGRWQIKNFPKRLRATGFPSPVAPLDVDGSRSFPTRTGFFGYGYDNLGNGIGANFGIRQIANRFLLPTYGGEYPRDYRWEDSIVHYPIYGNGYIFERERPIQTRLQLEEGRRVDEACGQNARTAHTASDNLSSSKEDNKLRKTDHNYVSSQKSVGKDSRRSENFDEQLVVDRNEANKSTLRSNRVNRIGHTVRGFSIHHHKDETGNTTTFYDQFSDRGGQFDFKDFGDGYEARTRLKQAGDTEGGKFFRKSGVESTSYDADHAKDDQKSGRGVASGGDRSWKEKRFDKGRESEVLKRRKIGYHSEEPGIFHQSEFNHDHGYYYFYY